MSNINLLPEDLREREAREAKRMAHKPKVFEIDLSSPAKNKTQETNFAPPKNFWSAFRSQPKAQAAKLPSEERAKSLKVDLLSAAKKYKRESKSKFTAPKEKPKSASWFKLGPARPLIKSVPNGLNKSATPPSSARPFSAVPEKKAHLVREPKAKKGFWFWPHRSAKANKILAPTPNLKIAAEKISPVNIDFVKDREKIGNGQVESKHGRIKEDGWGNIFHSFKKEKHQTLPAQVMLSTEKSVAEKPTKIKEKIKKEKAVFGSKPPKKKKSMLNINLIPEELIFREKINPHGQLAAWLLAIIFPALVIYGAHWLIGAYQKEVNNQISQKQTDLTRLKATADSYQKIKQKNVLLQQKLIAIKTLFDNHLYWSNFFSGLEKYTLDGVYYTDFSADMGGEFTLPAIAANYEVAAKQIMAFRQAPDFIKEVKVDKIALHSTDKAGITGVEFELKIKLADNVFKKISK